jgi:hypothetical protein
MLGRRALGARDPRKFHPLGRGGALFENNQNPSRRRKSSAGPCTAQPATDGPFNSCNQDIAQPVRIRLQACNGYGCSPFGPATLLQFYQQCL